MTTRRSVLALIGWAVPSWAVTARGIEQHLSSLVAVDDPQVKVIENVWIPMADGTRLAARLFLPASAETTPGGSRKGPSPSVPRR